MFFIFLDNKLYELKILSNRLYLFINRNIENILFLGTNDSPISKLTSPKSRRNLSPDVVFSVVTSQTHSDNHIDEI